MTCTAGNMFRSHDKRAQGLFFFEVVAFAMIVMIVVLAAQGTKNL